MEAYLHVNWNSDCHTASRHAIAIRMCAPTRPCTIAVKYAGNQQFRICQGCAYSNQGKSSSNSFVGSCSASCSANMQSSTVIKDFVISLIYQWRSIDSSLTKLQYSYHCRAQCRSIYTHSSCSTAAYPLQGLQLLSNMGRGHTAHGRHSKIKHSYGDPQLYTDLSLWRMLTCLSQR